MTASSKQVAIRTEANADELKFGLHDAVNQDKVWLDVAIAITGVVSRNSMVAQRGRKRLSARRLISGFTRNAIVAEFIGNRFLLFDNSRQYSTFAFFAQAGDFNDGLWGNRIAA